MKKKIISLCVGIAIVYGLATASVNVETKKVLEDGTVVINTTDIAKDVQGYVAGTPVEIYLHDGKIQNIKPLPNQESPGYFYTVVKSGLLKKWNGLTPKEALDVHVDAVSGATFSSTAVIQNVQAGLRYARDNQ